MRAQQGFAPVVVVAILAILVLAGSAAYFTIHHSGQTTSPLTGVPVKNPATGLYTIYVLVFGHRDRTPLHFDLHANIHVDSVSVYYTSPANPPNGDTWGGFDKSVSVTLHVNGSSLSPPIVSSFVMPTIGLGAQWGQVVSFDLPSGNYTILAVGVDQGGYQSSASTMISLP